MDTADHWLRLIRHTLGGSSSIEPLKILNRCGVWLCSAHRWKWLERPPVPMHLTQGQEYVVLPDECVSLITVEGGGTQVSFEPTSVSEVMSLRRGIGVATSAYVYALVYEPGTLARRLELYPTPTSNGLDSISVHYRAGWTRCTSDDSDVVVPEFVEPLLDAAVVEYARGTEMEDEATLDQRLGRIRASAMFAEAVDADGSSQVDLGQMLGGAEGSGYDVQVTAFVPIASL
jgi:hypothetical protein